MAEVMTVDDPARRARRKRLLILVIPIGIFYVTSLVMGFLAPAMINEHPLVVVAFNPINRYLIVAANRVEVWEFFLVGFVRLLLTDPLYFLLGRWFGDGALDWIESKTGNSGTIPFVKKWFGKAGPAIVFLAPNTYVCLLAGASGMKVRTFIALNVTGTVTRLILIKATGDVFEPVLDPILDFVKRYQWQLVIFSVVMFVLQSAMNKKQGKTSELESITRMTDELEDAIDKREHEHESTPAKQAPVAKTTAPAKKTAAAKKPAAVKKASTAKKAPAAKKASARKSPAKKL